MKTIFKILILSTFIIFCLLSVGVYASDSNYDLLKKIDIIDEVINDDAITRAEAAELLFKASGRINYIDSDKSFNDVDEYHPNYKEIESLAALDVLTGDQNSYFYPSNEISCMDFAVALIRLAGYKDYAEATGGYPSGYLKIANKYDLIGDNNLYSGISFTDALDIILNYLDMPVCDVSGIAGTSGSHNFIYDISEDYTVLEHNFLLEKRNGTIVGINGVSLFGYPSCESGNIVVADSEQKYIYRINGSDFDDCLGYEVYYYVNDETETVIFVQKRRTGQVINLDYNGIASISADRTKVTYYYGENRKHKDILISHDATFILNGTNYYEMTPDEMHQRNVRLKLIDVDNNKVFDIVYVERYKNIVVEAFDAKEKTVTCRLTGEAYNLDSDDLKEGINFIHQNNKATFADVRKGDVLSILTNKEGTKMTAYISRDYIEGYVTTISPGENTIDIDDETYTVLFDTSDGNLSLGEMIKLYVDYDGKGCCYETLQNIQGEYAYLIDVEKGSRISGGPSAMFLLENGEKVIYDFHKLFKVNGKRCDYEGLVTELEKADTIHQLVYIVVRDGKIKSLNTASVENGFPEYGGYDRFTLDYAAPLGECAVYGYNIGLKFIASDVTKIFYIAVDDLGNIYEDELIAGDYGQLRLNNLSPKLKVYDSSVHRVPKVIVVYGSVGKQDTYFRSGELSYTPLLVENVFYRLNEDDEYVQCVQGMVKGLPRTFYATDGLKFDELERGDVIKLGYYRGNELFSYNKLFTITRSKDDPVSILSSDGNYTNDSLAFDKPTAISKTEITSVYGTVEEVGIPEASNSPDYQNEGVYYGSIVIRPEGGTDEDCITLPGSFLDNDDTKGTYIYLYDQQNNTIQFVNFRDIDLVGRKVYSYFYYNRARIIVVYE